MDPVTHTLLGVTAANALFRRRAGAAAVPILALASNLPDIDALVHLGGDPAAVLMRRTFGHSLLLLPIWVAALAWLLRRRWRHLRYREILGMVAAGAGLHLFFDLVNSFGVVLFWPLGRARPELAWVFIIDLVLTGLLALPLLAAIARRWRPRIAPMSRAALAAVALYVALCGAGHARAMTLLERVEVEGMGDDLADLGPDWVEVETLPPPDFLYVFPEPWGPRRWRGVARTGERYRIYAIDVAASSAVLRRQATTHLSDPRVARARATPLGRRLEAFFKAPVWEIEAGSGEARVYDIRFQPLALARPPAFPMVVPRVLADRR